VNLKVFLLMDKQLFARINIFCHSGLDPESTLFFWIPAFAGMTINAQSLKHI